MDSVLKTVQRFLYIGSDVPFVFDPPKPLNMELGKKVLGPAVNPVDPDAKQPAEPPVTTETSGQKKIKNKQNDNLKLKQGGEKAVQGGKHSKPETPKAATTESNSTTSTKPVETVATVPLHPVLALIKSTFKSKSLHRTDECLFALAYCARNFATPEERHTVYELLPELIRTSHDLLTFVSYYTQLATQSGHAGFGHGLRTAIKRWYEKFTPMDLAEMLVRSTSTEGWSHKDVIAKARPKLDCPDKQSLLDAAMKRTSQLQQKKAPEKKGKKKRQKENATIAPPPAPVNKETATVAVNASKAFRRYQTLLQFKSAPNAVKALELMKQYGAKGKFELLPRHLHRFAKVWEAMYPHLTYRELLHAALPMQDFRLLKEDEANTKAYVETLKQRFNALEVECIHPIEVYTLSKLYQHGKRYVTKVKESIHSLYLTDMCPPVQDVQDCLDVALEHSLSHHPKTGVRYYIALDLRCVYDRKKIFHNEVITCFQASVLLAFAIYKREKNVTVVAFTDDKEALASVEFKPTMTLSQAMKLCVGLMLPTTKVSLAAPIKQAEADKIKVDVFITITDSLIRVNPTRCPPTAQLQEYRKKMKLNLTRYVAISLSHHKPSLDFEPGKDTDGLLEMVGYSANNAKIIEAFAKNHFF